MYGMSGCVWSDVPQGAVFACTPERTCDDGLECRFGYCRSAIVAEDSGVPDAGPPCVPVECQAVGATCGPISDGCGKVKQCGSCPSPSTCGGGLDGGRANTCGCTPLTAAQMCAIAGKNC